MKLTSHAARRLAAAAITCTSFLLPAAALAAPGSAATAGSPTSPSKPSQRRRLPDRRDKRSSVSAARSRLHRTSTAVQSLSSI